MWYNPYQQSQDLEVLSASPVELVHLLYRGAIDSIDLARRHLAAGEIKERSRQISKACSIVEELIASLDHNLAPTLTKDLASLYEYMHYRLCQANIEQLEPPLVEVRSLLVTVLESWTQLLKPLDECSESHGSIHEHGIRFREVLNYSL